MSKKETTTKPTGRKIDTTPIFFEVVCLECSQEQYIPSNAAAQCIRCDTKLFYSPFGRPAEAPEKEA